MYHEPVPEHRGWWLPVTHNAHIPRALCIVQFVAASHMHCLSVHCPVPSSVQPRTSQPRLPHSPAAQHLTGRSDSLDCFCLF